MIKTSCMFFAEREISLSKETASEPDLVRRDLQMTLAGKSGRGVQPFQHTPHLPPLPSSVFLKDTVSVPIFSVLPAAGLT